MYNATLTDGLSYSLGTRRFTKDEPQLVSGEIAAILDTKGFRMDVQKNKGVVDAAWQKYFTLEETDETVAGYEARIRSAKEARLSREGRAVEHTPEEEEMDERADTVPIQAPPVAPSATRTAPAARAVRRAGT